MQVMARKGQHFFIVFFSGKRVVGFVGERLQPFVGGFHAGNFDGKVAEPAVLFEMGFRLDCP